jgi:two-component system chemotaxis response regulator CheB
MEKRNIIVIGASAGGFEALKTLVAKLPSDLDASIFIVWHMAATVRGILPDVLNRLGGMDAVEPQDGEWIESNKIYVARPDHHLLIDERRIRSTRGPRENRFRPAVDPLFRSAAREFRSRVIGVVLSGALDDGTAGLWAVKSRGGLAVVQDPWDAEIPSMPENAIRAVAVDHVVPIAEMGELLARLSQVGVETPDGSMQTNKDEAEKIDVEVKIAAQNSALEMGSMKFGELSPFTCPECRGVLSMLTEGKLKRFRCHTGHAYSPDTLLATVTENIEKTMWDTIRGVEESVMLLNHLGDHFAEVDNGRDAAAYFNKANQSMSRLEILRNFVFSNETLSIDALEQKSDEDGETAHLVTGGNGWPAAMSAKR